ncbi:MAG TPA: dipeptidase [Planctomycetota bacterium]|nr:dipeptidase [Planctomycetota bacterium]
MDFRQLHFDAILVDGHADTISRFLDDGDDLGTETGKGHLDLPRMIRGGIDCQFLACFVEPRYEERGLAAVRALRMIDAVKRWIGAHPDRMVLARTAADVRRAVAEGKVCGVLCIEGGHAIQDDLALLRTFGDLGVRYMTLTWNNSTSWAHAARAKGPDTGLNDFGREVVREMNRIGMLVDLSHVSEKTFYDALAVANTPAICSHSCARALCDHPRNLTDDQLRALAKNGGVVGVNFYSGFLSRAFTDSTKDVDRKSDEEDARVKALHGENPAKLDAELRRSWKAYEAALGRLPRPPLSALFDHIEHIVKVAGIDHVGLGSDFDGVGSLPQDIDDAQDLPKITGGLLQRGFSEDDVRKILGGNFLRVMEQSIDRVIGLSGQ